MDRPDSCASLDTSTSPLLHKSERTNLAIALYHPEIPHNTGTLIRLGACLGVAIHVIEPTGFLWSDTHLKRSTLDYSELCQVERHASWEAFVSAQQPKRRIILLDTKGEHAYVDCVFQDTDLLLFGAESHGVPPSVFSSIPLRLRIPMRPNARSINLAVAAGMVIGEALRQRSRPMR